MGRVYRAAVKASVCIVIKLRLKGNLYMDNILKDHKTEKVAELIAERAPRELKKILVVGCGSGLEAAILAIRLNAEVVGIDLEGGFNAEAKKFARLKVGNALDLSFDDSFFDFVYSYHALEHITEPRLCLSEIRRVLRPGGGYWIGTPNRHRILGYIGSKQATFGKKVKYNIVDWRARLTGKFRNDLGAHAGFSASELGHMLAEAFNDVENASDQYYKKIYSNKESLLAILRGLHLTDIAYPSVYFMGLNCK
jgi:ubiquinone/menaquinone biosynthesis C-methylase UbiE